MHAKNSIVLANAPAGRALLLLLYCATIWIAPCGAADERPIRTVLQSMFVSRLSTETLACELTGDEHAWVWRMQGAGVFWMDSAGMIHQTRNQQLSTLSVASIHSLKGGSRALVVPRGPGVFVIEVGDQASPKAILSSDYQIKQVLEAEGGLWLVV